MVKTRVFGIRMTWLQVVAPTFLTLWTWPKCLKFSKPQSSYPYNGNNNRTYYTALLWGVNQQGKVKKALCRMLAWRMCTVVLAIAHTSGGTFVLRPKLICFWFRPRRREKASEKVTIWCQKDPSKAITRIPPPGFPLPVVKPLPPSLGHY